MPFEQNSYHLRDHGDGFICVVMCYIFYIGTLLWISFDDYSINFKTDLCWATYFVSIYYAQASHAIDDQSLVPGNISSKYTKPRADKNPFSAGPHDWRNPLCTKMLPMPDGASSYKRYRWFIQLFVRWSLYYVRIYSRAVQMQL